MRQAMMLKAEGLSQQEVAAKMQISENTLEQHLRKAYAAIRGTRKMRSFSVLFTGTDD
jgi:DNA-binding CsgD family transcriptional regulator